MGLLEPLGTAENVLLFEHDTEHTSGIRTQNAKLQNEAEQQLDDFNSD